MSDEIDHSDWLESQEYEYDDLELEAPPAWMIIGLVVVLVGALVSEIVKKL